jgi:carnitine O-acetyltransferase
MSHRLILPFFLRIDGFFDAGMLRQALHANRGDGGAEPVERDVIRRNIGRRLRLAEY